MTVASPSPGRVLDCEHVSLDFTPLLDGASFISDGPVKSKTTTVDIVNESKATAFNIFSDGTQVQHTTLVSHDRYKIITIVRERRIGDCEWGAQTHNVLAFLREGRLFVKSTVDTLLLAQGLNEEAVTQFREALKIALDEKAKICYSLQKAKVADTKMELVGLVTARQSATLNQVWDHVCFAGLLGCSRQDIQHIFCN